MTMDGEHRQQAAGDSLPAPPHVRLPGPARGRGRLTGAVLAALALHTAALLAVLVAFDAQLGHDGRTSDVVEVSLVRAEDLRAEAEGSAPVVTGGVTLGDKPGASDADTVAGSASATPAPMPAETPVEVAAPSQDHALALPPATEGDAAATRPDIARTGAAPAAAPGDASVTSVAGGAPAIAAEPQRDVTAAPSASEGEVNAYNQRVAVTLSKLKPRGVGEPGLARVVFRIGTSGAVDDVKLAASTGKSKLDRLATDTVARAKFDTPPAGMTSAQLTYAVAFRFR